MGDLFAQLCRTRTETGTTRSLGYDSSRFLSASTAIRRVLEKWPALVEWYEKRRRKALRKRTVRSSLPLANDKANLVQPLSLLSPLSILLRQCQKDDANQVNVCLATHAALGTPGWHLFRLGKPKERFDLSFKSCLMNTLRLLKLVLRNNQQNISTQ